MGNTQGRRRNNTLTREADDVAIPTPPSARGLHENCTWDERSINKLILEKKLAPKSKGSEEESSDTEECPICFLNYDTLNTSNCCKHLICTECFLQVKRPRGAANCPFCASVIFTVSYTGLICEKSPKVKIIPPSVISNNTENNAILGNINSASLEGFSTPTSQKASSLLCSGSDSSADTILPDSTSSSNMATGSVSEKNGNVLPASASCSVEARKALEKEMMTQRAGSMDSDYLSSQPTNRRLHRAFDRYAASTSSSGSSSFLLRYRGTDASQQTGQRPYSRGNQGRWRGAGGRLAGSLTHSQSTSAADHEESDEEVRDADFETELSTQFRNARNRDRERERERDRMRRELAEYGYGSASGRESRGGNRLTDLAQIEEIMMVEAMRLSIEESKSSSSNMVSPTSSSSSSRRRAATAAAAVAASAVSRNIGSSGNKNSGSSTANTGGFLASLTSSAVSSATATANTSTTTAPAKGSGTSGGGSQSSGSGSNSLSLTNDVDLLSDDVDDDERQLLLAIALSLKDQGDVSDSGSGTSSQAYEQKDEVKDDNNNNNNSREGVALPFKSSRASLSDNLRPSPKARSRDRDRIRQIYEFKDNDVPDRKKSYIVSGRSASPPSILPTDFSCFDNEDEEDDDDDDDNIWGGTRGGRLLVDDNGNSSIFNIARKIRPKISSPSSPSSRTSAGSNVGFTSLVDKIDHALRSPPGKAYVPSPFSLDSSPSPSACTFNSNSNSSSSATAATAVSSSEYIDDEDKAWMKFTATVASSSKYIEPKLEYKMQINSFETLNNNNNNINNNNEHNNNKQSQNQMVSSGSDSSHLTTDLSQINDDDDCTILPLHATSTAETSTAQQSQSPMDGESSTTSSSSSTKKPQDYDIDFSNLFNSFENFNDSSLTEDTPLSNDKQASTSNEGTLDLRQSR